MLSNIFYIYLFLLLHPVHVAITGVDIEADGTISVTHKFYTDDFTLLFFHLYEKNIIPADGEEFAEADIATISKYLKDAFVIETEDGFKADFEYTGKDQDDESVWIYMKGRLPEDASDTLKITNNLMFDIYMDQTNLVILSEGGTEHGLSFYYNQRTTTICIN